MERLNSQTQDASVREDSFRPSRPLSFDANRAIEKSNEHSPQFTLKEYQNAFSYIYDVYGLDQSALKIGVLESVMMIHAISRQLIGPYINTRLRSMLGTDSGGSTGEDPAVFMREAKKLALIVGSITAGELFMTLLDGSARKAYETEAFAIRKKVNDRVANSVFMRDFEFMHDKAPAEILNIIDRGKQGTMDIISTTVTEIIPRLTSIVAASSAGFRVDKRGGIIGLLRLPLLYWTNKNISKQILVDRQAELMKKDVVDTSIMNSLQSIEGVKTSDTMTDAIRGLGEIMQERDAMITESTKKHISRRQQESYFMTLFEEIMPLMLGYIDFTELMKQGNKPERSALMAYNQYRTIGFKQRSIGAHATALLRVFAEKIQPALQDIQRMEELLGPYDQLDKPDGLLEKLRIPADTIPNFDIRVSHVRYKQILHDVSLDIPQGSFVTIKGPSGIGKTTLLRHMLGLYGVPEGSVTYGDIDLAKIKKFGEHSIYTQLAYANQNPLYFDNRTLRENLLLWTNADVHTDQLVAILRDLRLDYIIDRLDSKEKHFSGGELRRIGIARALLKNPKVLFLDEPTANLDQVAARQVLEIIKEMRRKRPDMTVVAVTHDPNFEAIAERIVDFAEVNKPKDTTAESLGTRQEFYASAKVN